MAENQGGRDGELAVVAFEAHAPVADAKAILIRPRQAFDVAGEIGSLREPGDGAQDSLARRRVDLAQILAGSVVNDDAPLGLGHAPPSSAATSSSATGLTPCWRSAWASATA